MAISEKRRHELMKRVEQVFGSDHAETMMELLPPVGWADVATKADLYALEQRLATKDELHHVRHELKDEMHQLRRDVITWLLAAMSIQTAVIGILLLITHA